MAITAAVNGVPLQLQNMWSVKRTANGVHVVDCEVISLVGTRAVAIDDDFTMSDGATVIFGGVVVDAEERALGWKGINTQIATRVTVHDYNVLADWRGDIYGDRPAELTKARLTWLAAAYFACYGVTLAVGQMDGVMLDARSYNNESGAKVLDEIAALNSGAMRNISYAKVLSVFNPADAPAPFDIDSAETGLVEDVVVSKGRTADYASRVVVHYNRATTEQTDSFVATAGQTAFPLSKIQATNPGYLTVNGVPSTPFGSIWSVAVVGLDSSLAGRFALVYGSSTNWNALRPSPYGTGNTNPDTVALYNEAVTTWGASADWNGLRVVVSASGWALVRSSGATVGDTIDFTYTAGTPDVAIADNGSPRPRVVAITVPNVSDPSAAQALADAYLAQRDITTQKVTYSTTRSGLMTGQTQTIAIPERAISGIFLLANVDTRDDLEDTYYDVTAVPVAAFLSTANLRSSYQQWFNSGVASGVTIVASGAGSSRNVYQLATGIDATQTDGVHGMPAAGGGAVGTSPIQPVIDTVLRGTVIATVKARLCALDAGVSVYARLYDVTASAYCPGVSATITSTAFVDAFFAVTLTAGAHAYELHLFSPTAGKDIRGSGYVE